MKKAIIPITASIALLAVAVLSYFLIKETAELSSKDGVLENTVTTVADETQPSGEAALAKKEDKKEDKKKDKKDKKSQIPHL